VKTLSIASAILPILIGATLIAPAAAYEFPPAAGDFNANPGSHPTPAPDEVRGHWYYPSASQLKHEEGTVGLKIFLTDEGTMRDAAIEKSSGFPRLDEAALKYAQEKYQYRLAMGEEMPQMARITVKFDLN
jgi:TonB family protein